MAGSKHANKTTFKKGTSGNPGGRSPRVGPNGETAAQLARTHTAAAIQTLADGLTAPEWQVRVACSQALLDRGWGKPTEFVDAKVKGGGLHVIQIVRAAEAPARED
jgi:hypothetical protein